MAAGAVRVRGLRELNHAFSHMAAAASHDLKDELVRVGDPVRVTAEKLAVENITNIGERWSRMRLGVTSRVVYVAPKAHRHRGTPRPNLAGLLLKKAMLPALDENEAQVVAGIERMLDNLGAKSGF